MQKTNFISKGIAPVVALFALVAPAAAQEWVFGVGYSDFSRNGAEDSALISAEYHHTPFYENGRLSSAFGAVLSAQTEGDVFVGAGLVATLDLNDKWFLETSVMPGAFFESAALNDLGSTFEIRSLLGVGRNLNNGQKVSLAILHKSNASTGNINPGVNSVLLRWHTSF